MLMDGSVRDLQALGWQKQEFVSFGMAGIGTFRLLDARNRRSSPSGWQKTLLVRFGWRRGLQASGWQE